MAEDSDISKKLPVVSETTVQLLEQSSGYTCFNRDALYVCDEILTSRNMLRKGRGESCRLWLTQARYEQVARELLLQKGRCVQIYRESGAGKLSVVSTMSPGRLGEFEADVFEGEQHSAAGEVLALRVSATEKGGHNVAIASLNPLRRILSVAEFPDDVAFTNAEFLLVQLNVKEFIVPPSPLPKALQAILDKLDTLVTPLPLKHFAAGDLIEDLNKLIKFDKGMEKNAHHLPQMSQKLAVTCLAALIHHQDLIGAARNQFKLCTLQLEKYMRLDATALKALDIVGEKRGAAYATLYGLLNHCRTGGGQRLLDQWLRQPLVDFDEIKRRQELVALFVDEPELRHSLSNDSLKRLPDFHKLSRKLLLGRGTLQDCYKIFLAVRHLPVMVASFQDKESILSSEIITAPLQRSIADFSKFLDLIETVLDLEKAGEGEFMVRATFDEDLYTLRSALNNVEGRMETAHHALLDKLDSKSAVKLEQTTQHGWVFRVAKSQERSLEAVSGLVVLQTVAAGVRFRDAALEKLNPKWQDARTAYEEQQSALVTEVMTVAAGYHDTLLQLGETLSTLDCLVSLAVAATWATIPYCRPTILPRGSGKIEFTGLRHACLEAKDGVCFISNDAILTREAHFHVITGPNMGGKSTYIRSVALAVLMAQIGSFVPAHTATVSLTDAIFTRVGAADCLLRGVSTFMAEMLESAAILRCATADSLLIIDELGRGTSTYDGCGLAWAISEHIARDIGAYALFASHFHELTELADSTTGVANFHVTAIAEGDQLAFLYKVEAGACTESLGIAVARMAGFPADVLATAEEKLAQLDFAWHGNKSEQDEGDVFINRYLRDFKSAVGDEMKLSQLRKCAGVEQNPFIKQILKNL